ncbi:MAG: aminodeoxychorismate/anthranilate synthase component II, partial [Actinobacteria bacterium]|nr:aminodeoxychorismate/anthranilate synthase component II [Actinomycetota bacterium]
MSGPSAGRVLILDNYDSFTYNLVQYLGELGADPVVIRNDVLKPSEVVDEISFDRLVISPGPGVPEAAGFSVEYVRTFGPTIPTLGVCLGHQAIAVAYGGRVDLAPEPRHGKTSSVHHDGAGIFDGLDNPFTATRYHSLAAVELPDELQPCAWSEDGVIQG